MAGFDITQDKQDKRLHLLEVARHLFALHGYEAVSIRQIAREARINIAMVSYYFGSKEKLFAAVIENKFPKTRESLERLAESDIHPWEKISKTIDIYVDLILTGCDFHRVIMREMSLKQRPELVEAIARNMNRNMEIIRKIILEGQEKGVFRYVDNEMTIASIFGSITVIVNSSTLVCVMLGQKEEEGLYSESARTRVKNHLKSMLQCHLMIAK
jgi:AcrR family transcriptional regulator